MEPQMFLEGIIEIVLTKLYRRELSRKDAPVIRVIYLAVVVSSLIAILTVCTCTVIPHQPR